MKEVKGKITAILIWPQPKKSINNQLLRLKETTKNLENILTNNNIILVGNKIDMDYTNKRVVSYEKADNFVKKHN